MGFGMAMALLAGCAARPSAAPSAPSAAGGPAAAAPAASAGKQPACDTLLNPDVAKISAAAQQIAASGGTPYPTYWTLSVNFKEIKNGAPVACFKVYEWDGKNYVPTPKLQTSDGERQDVCTTVGKVTYSSSGATQTYASNAAVFEPGGYIACKTNIAGWLNQLGYHQPMTDTYDAFDLGAAGVFTVNPAKRSNVNMSMLYEPGSPCQAKLPGALACGPLAQTMPRTGTDITFESYFNQPVSPGSGAVTPHADPNVIVPSSTNCTFDANNKDEHAWWAHVGPDVRDNKTYTEKFFHYTFDVGNSKLQIRCDGSTPATTTKKDNGTEQATVTNGPGSSPSVEIWLGEAMLYVGGGPSRDSWDGALEEIIIDPQDAGAGGG